MTPSSPGRSGTGSWSCSARRRSSGAGLWAMRTTPLDAIPDLSDVQVIVQTDFSEQAPQIVEDQVTYPITSGDAQGARGARRARLLLLRPQPRLRDLRGRHRHLLGALPGARVPERHPASAAATGSSRLWARTPPAWAGSSSTCSNPTASTWPSCAPCRTGTSGTSSRPCPASSEVASLGGFVKQYQVEVDPERLRAFDIPVTRVAQAIGCAQRRHRRPGARDGRPRVHDPRARLPQGRRRHRERLRRGARRTAPRSGSPTWPPSRSVRRRGVAPPTSTDAAKSSPASW